MPPLPVPHHRLVPRSWNIRAASLSVIVVSLQFGLAQAGGAQSPTIPSLSVEERILGLSQIWQEVNRSFAFKTRLAFDVDSAYRESLTRVIAARDTYEYYRELQRFTAALHDGHSGVSFPSSMASERTYPWLLTRWIDGHLVISNSGRALASTFPAWTEILTIDGRPATEYLAAEVLPYTPASTEHWRWAAGARDALDGRARDAVHLTFQRPNGTRGDTTLARDRRTRNDSWAMPTELPRLELRWLRDSVAHVLLHTFGSDSIKQEFVALIPTLRRARGLILDVRGNGGGNSGNGWDILAHLTKDTLPLQAWRTRLYNAAYRGWNRPGFGADSAFTPFDTTGAYPPYADPLTVPTVILQDHETFSAAEDFLVAADEIPRLVTMGQPSGGSTGNPVFWKLPGGGFARIVSKHDRYRDGREFVGVGVQPKHVLPPLTLADVRAGRDPMIDEALATLRQRPATKD